MLELYSEIVNVALYNGRRSLKSNVSITALPFFENKGFEVLKKQKILRQNLEFINFKMIKALQ